MADSPKILTIRLQEPDEVGIGVEIEYGTKSLTKKIPTGMGMTRLSIVLDAKGQLADCELVSEKV